MTSSRRINKRQRQADTVHSARMGVQAWKKVHLFYFYLFGGLCLLHGGRLAALPPQGNTGDLLAGGDVGGTVGNAQEHLLQGGHAYTIAEARWRRRWPQQQQQQQQNRHSRCGGRRRGGNEAVRMINNKLFRESIGHYCIP